MVDADKILSSVSRLHAYPSEHELLTTQLIVIPTKRTFQYVEQSVNNVIMLKTYVSSIKPVYMALATAQSSLLLTIREVSIQCVRRSDLS